MVVVISREGEETFRNKWKMADARFVVSLRWVDEVEFQRPTSCDIVNSVVAM